MSNQSISGPATLFFAYAQEDEALREQLEHHLALLQRQSLLLSWHDRQIEAGDDWKRAIDEHLETASIILLLISPAFLASDYCYEIEMQRAMERQEAGQARVIPLLLRPCDWQTASFGRLQALPHDGRAITTWTNQDEAFLQVSRSLRALLAQPPVPISKTSGTATQNRANMLVKLQRTYDEMLDDSLQKLVWIDLPLNRVPDAVHTTANLLLRRTNLPAQPLAPGTSIQKAYQQANQQLLILGEPGAGKSTLLYQLGRDLLAQVHQPHQPLPIVFPLSSWSKLQPSLAGWMVEQLCSPLYKVPRRQSQQWVQNQQILPLLDGLDEVEEAARPACIAAINAYCSIFPMCSLVVCSRSQEYQTASQHERLHLHSAIEVQSLTPLQQEEALQQAGSAAEGLRAELATNEELRALARTPLWLTLLLVATREAPLPTLPQERAALQWEVLRRYVERMCERKGDAARYPLKQTIHWLGFLAGQMRQHNQTIFSLAQLRLDWLPKKQRNFYLWSFGLCQGLAIGSLSFLILSFFAPILFAWIMWGLVVIGGCVMAVVIGDEPETWINPKPTWSWGEFGDLLSGLLLLAVVVVMMGLTFGPSVAILVMRVGFIIFLNCFLVSIEDTVPNALLRLWLAHDKVFPWQAIVFLNDTCERALLKRVGGTYRFIHRLVLDYFADQESHNTHTSIDLATTNISEHSVQRRSPNTIPQKGEDSSL